MSEANMCYKLERMQRTMVIMLPSALTDLIRTAAAVYPVVNTAV